MQCTEIAIAKPFEGAPKINLPDIFGASINKGIILRVPVTGERPITYEAKNLPEGLSLKDGIVTGKVEEAGDYKVTFIAKNKLGTDEKEITIEIGENGVLLTPLMGFTSWNAYGTRVRQEDIEKTAERMVESGICEYGYSYVNTDSGWQKEYGGKFDAIMPNDKFPDMKKMCDKIHSYGLKCGIYSTPMLLAWGCPDELNYSIPGCTVGEPDDLFATTNSGIGKIRKEKNNVLQWTEWGFDYLKYDWVPCDPYNAELMRRELKASERDFGFCVTVGARPEYVNYWSKYCNSYRNSTDAMRSWENFIELYDLSHDSITIMKKGHFYDVDMLDIGTCNLFSEACLLEMFPNRRDFTKDEQILVYTYRAFMGSPIQISSTLENIDDFELSVYCNEEIIAINQDIAFSSAKPHMMLENGKKRIHVYKRKLHDDSCAIAVFNLGETTEEIKVYLDEKSKIRDVWAKKDIMEKDVINLTTHPHTVRVFKATKID